LAFSDNLVEWLVVPSGRNPAIEILREADKVMMLPHLRGNLFINWIPAFAGMTRLWLWIIWVEISSMLAFDPF
jgi:hypothetical protein